MENNEEVNEGTSVEIKDPKAVLEALERAKADAKKYREQAEALEAEKTTLNERIQSLESDDTVASWKNKVKEMQAKQKIAESGVTNADRVLSFMDLEKLELDDTGNLKGFDEGLSDVKTRLPELFDKKRAVAAAADAHAQGEVKQQKTTTEIQLERLQHKA